MPETRRIEHPGHADDPLIRLDGRLAGVGKPLDVLHDVVNVSIDYGDYGLPLKDDEDRVARLIAGTVSVVAPFAEGDLIESDLECTAITELANELFVAYCKDRVTVMSFNRTLNRLVPMLKSQLIGATSCFDIRYLRASELVYILCRMNHVNSSSSINLISLELPSLTVISNDHVQHDDGSRWRLKASPSPSSRYQLFVYRTDAWLFYVYGYADSPSPRGSVLDMLGVWRDDTVGVRLAEYVPVSFFVDDAWYLFVLEKDEKYHFYYCRRTENQMPLLDASTLFETMVPLEEKQGALRIKLSKIVIGFGLPTAPIKLMYPDKLVNMEVEILPGPVFTRKPKVTYYDIFHFDRDQKDFFVEAPKVSVGKSSVDENRLVAIGRIDGGQIGVVLVSPDTRDVYTHVLKLKFEIAICVFVQDWLENQKVRLLTYSTDKKLHPIEVGGQYRSYLRIDARNLERNFTVAERIDAVVRVALNRSIPYAENEFEFGIALYPHVYSEPSLNMTDIQLAYIGERSFLTVPIYTYTGNAPSFTISSESSFESVISSDYKLPIIGIPENNVTITFFKSLEQGYFVIASKEVLKVISCLRTPNSVRCINVMTIENDQIFMDMQYYRGIIYQVGCPNALSAKYLSSALGHPTWYMIPL